MKEQIIFCDEETRCKRPLQTIRIEVEKYLKEKKKSQFQKRRKYRGLNEFPKKFLRQEKTQSFAKTTDQKITVLKKGSQRPEE